MIPGLGEKYNLEIEMTLKLYSEYHTEEYAALGLPAAPAVMFDDELITQGVDVDEHEFEAEICRRLGLPEPERKEKGSVGGLVFDVLGFVLDIFD